MESFPLRSLLAAFFTVLFFFRSEAADPKFNIDEVKPRFEAMECIVKPKYNATVEGYIKKYLSNNGALTKRIMGKSAVYFPIFDKYLQEHNLPQDLKYLSILESALNPKAVSPVGATGLWQFMSETARGYGLTINKEVDERSCAHNSTEAAMQYLQRQYERFGSWELALASYNCGAGVINNAIKRARSDDYWELAQYLPRETRNFVPAFLSAAYIANYYHLHDIQPEFPDLDKQLTEAVKVYVKLDFKTIASLTGLPVEVVAEMNPAFRKGYVPANPEGHDVILPRRVSLALSEYLDMLRPDNKPAEMPALPTVVDSSSYTPDSYYFRSVYTVVQGDEIFDLAAVFSCSPYNLKIWNNLTSYHLKPGQELSIWFPNEIKHFTSKTGERIQIVAAPQPVTKRSVIEEDDAPMIRDSRPAPGNIPSLQPAAPSSPAAKPKVPLAAPVKPVQPKPAMPKAKKIQQEQGNGIIYYQLQRNESLFDVALQFPGVTVQNLMEWNGFSKTNLPMAGTNIRIVKG